MWPGLDVGIQQEAIIDSFNLVQNQILAGQSGLRMARGSRHCNISLKQYRIKLFWAILASRPCTESAEDPISTLP
jgi:hypothetical protein